MDYQSRSSTELKKDYSVYGAFRCFDNEIKFRRVLEIIRKQAVSLPDANEIKSLTPDAVFVMMNPGSSRPLNPNHFFLDELVDTEPDPTQYQLMRLMDKFGWNHVRVLNLSDYCEPKSTKFIDKLIKREHFLDNHSVFHSSRKAELDDYLAGTNVVVVAWGLNSHLHELAGDALIALNRDLIIGKRGKHELSFYHPLPRNYELQRNWLSSITSQFEEFYKDKNR